MTKQEVVNEILIHRAPDLTIYYTHDQLACMWEILVGKEWSRKSATKRDIVYALYLHVYRMNRAAAFQQECHFRVHTVETDALRACVARNSEQTLMEGFPDEMLDVAYSQLCYGGKATTKREKLREATKVIKE